LGRGPALADFVDEPFAQAAIQQLEEQRLVALEAHAEARLELGEHQQVAVELTELVARQPLRETLRALQLRALYRSGRQTEALDSYHDLRTRLADELGLEPGPELAAVHQSILAQTVRPRSNLPTPLTELVGRAEAVATVRQLVRESRLVTLTGPGGVGKTRLAVETARHVVLRDGAWLVEFAGLDRHASPVEEAVAAVLDSREDLGTVADTLRGKEILLVLDNCERVVEPVAELVHRLLGAAPGLKVLTTSQEPLGLAGEVVWVVPPLDVTDNPLESSAVRLFAARARESAPGFSLGVDNSEQVAAICRRLDGIPLALELAATKVRALGVDELLRRLDDRFRLLATGNRGAPARQQTLRAMIDWSWELLGEPERTVLRRLAVHAESCSLEAAEAVCAGEGIDVLAVLARLVDRSLVVVLPGPRYRLLESVVAYCLERLDEVGELDRLQHNHLRYYVELAEQADGHVRGHEQQMWLRRLDIDTPNLRAALDGAVRAYDPDLALRLVNAQAWYWFLRGRLREGLRSLTIVLSLNGGDRALRARATAWQVGFHALIGENDAMGDEAKRALAAFDGVDDRAGLARAEWFLSYVMGGSGDLGVLEDLAARALVGFTMVEDDWGVAAAMSTLALQARPRGDFVGAKRNAEHSAAMFRTLGDRWGQLKAADVLSSIAEIEGDYAEAARLHHEGLRSANDLLLWIEMSYELSGLGRIALLTGDYAQADEYHRSAMRVAAEQSHLRGVQFAEIGLALSARRQGRLDDAEAHLTNWLDWCRRIEGDLGTALVLAELGFVAELRGDADEALRRHLEGYAAARNTGDQRAIALAMEGLAGAHALAGRHSEAARLLQEAASARGGPRPAAERGDVDRITAMVFAGQA
jgi:predicted ATPase